MIKFNLSPVLALLLGATMWGTIWYPLRLLEARGLHGLWLSATIYAAAFLFATPWWSGQWRALLKNWRYSSALALSSAGTNICFILAILDGHVVRVMLLFYLYPLWATLLGNLFLHERLSLRVVLTLALALGGAGIMLWHPSLGFPWPDNHAEWLAIFAGFSFAVSNVLARGAASSPLMHKCIPSWFGVAAVALALAVFWGVPSPPLRVDMLLGAAATGILGIFVMTLLVIYGVSRMPVQRSAIILLFEVVAGAVSAQWLAGEAILLKEIFGGLLIAAAAYVAVMPHGKNS